jgi:hypothetical protein
MADADNGWEKYGERVLSEMQDLKDCYKELSDKMITNKVDIAVLQVRAGMWGAVAGAIISGIFGLILFMLNKK